MKEKIIGISLLLLIVIGGVVYKFNSSGPDAINIKGYVGGEKINFLKNEKIQEILLKKYGITIDYTKAGSIEMVREDVGDDIDFLWPSSQVALELYRQKENNRLVKSEIIFNSPIVLYSWDIVTEALEEKGLLTTKDGVIYISDFSRFMKSITEGTTWKEMGVNQLYGRAVVLSTDPSKSNSGNMFSGLLANTLNGDVVTMQSLPQILPQVAAYYKSLGYLEHSSSDLFEQYLRTGVGAKPVVAGYENQIIEFSLAYRDLWPKIKKKVRIMYPIPTVWSSHPVIIIKKDATRLIEALQDEDIQRIAWESHGFRTGMIGIQNDPKVIDVIGIPDEVTQVIPMPGPDVMGQIIRAVE